MKLLRLIGCLLLVASTATSAAALTQGTSTVSNCGGELGNWIDVTFTTDEGVRLVDVWWDFNGTVVWLDQDGVSMCTPENIGVTTYTPYFDVPPDVDTQDWGCAFTGFDGGDYMKLKMDLDRGAGGTPFSEDFYGGTVTVEFSDGSTAVGTFDTDYDWPNGCTASFTVLAPALPNLAFNPRAGWAAPLVPRPAADATGGSVPAPLLLPGDATATWLNVTCQNDGTAGSGPPTLTIHRDGALLHSIDYLLGFAPGAYFGPINLGPEEFRSGRHTLRATVDPLDVIEEQDEGDNVYAAQYAWAAKTLTYNLAETRSAPPLASADLAFLPGPADENCDGVRLVKDGAAPGDQSDWMVVWSQRLAATGDAYFMRLFDATNDPVAGFSGPLATSRMGAGLQAFVVNTRNSAATLYDIGVFNPNGVTENYEVGATYEGSTNLSFWNELPVTGERLRIVEFFSPIGSLGPATLTLSTDPAAGPLHFGWLPANHDIGNLADLSDVVTTDASGRAKILFDLSLIGYHAAVLYQDGATAPLSATVSLLPAMPDLEPLEPGGWCAAVVPRPAGDATPSSCDLPDVLHGDAAATWLNAAMWNTGNAVADTVGFGFAFDGLVDLYTWTPVPNLDHGDDYIVTNMQRLGTPFTVRGGRHTLTCMSDYREYLAESFETNNWTGAQYCWTPPEISPGTATSRNAPPNRDGGHAQCDPGLTLYPNCDGLRLAEPSSYWRALAVMPPSTGIDVDVELHAPLTTVQDGFGPNKLAESTSGAGAIDFVLVNDNSAPHTVYDVGVLDDVDHSFAVYHLEAVESVRHTKFPVGQTGRFEMPDGSMLHLQEYFLAAGPIVIAVTDDGSGVDWGISVYGDRQFFGKADHLADGLASSAGPGGMEQVLVDIPVAGNYCIAVWKADSSQLGLDGAYRLNFAPGVTGVGDSPPTPIPATRLLGAMPNPFNPQTTIHYALVADGFCRLAVYDLQGRLVRTLIEEWLEAGQSEVVWDGRDDHGRLVASGVYVARLGAGPASDRMKLTLVK